MPVTNTACQLQEARQLQQLRQLRERKAWQALCAAQAEQRAAEHQLRVSEAALEQLQSERKQLSRRVVEEYAADIGRFAHNLCALQEKMDEQLERADDAVVEADEVLMEAKEAVTTAHSHWLRTVSQNSAADTLVADMRSAHVRQRETRLEREDDASPARSFFS